MFKRSSGVLLHITSLPSPYGVGTMGQAAYDFIDFLALGKQTYWQVLPLGHTGFGDSPYQCYSAAAGNPYLIDLDLLVQQGLLQHQQVAALPQPATPDFVDFEVLSQTRPALLQIAYENSKHDAALCEKVQAFRKANKDWVEDYALFMALRETCFDYQPLWNWPDKDLRNRQPAAMRVAKAQLAEQIDLRVFIQYLFFTQWEALRAYAHTKNVQLIGDMPIYVSPDSSDVWQHPALFKLNADLSSNKVAGVPPDYFSETGQLWGNPVYDWAVHADQKYAWWNWRMKQNAALFDVLRLDHFRGFEAYWEVGAKAKTAVHGKWIKGPGMDLFHALKKSTAKMEIIAEDLGVITPAVEKLLEDSGYPGMRVMIFGMFPEDNLHQPHNYVKNSIVYTSTHDSQTIYEQITDICNPTEADFARAYLRWDGKEPVSWAAVRTLHASCAAVAMVAMQDLLNLGADARMNKPSTLGGNWQWRVRREALNGDIAGFLRGVTETNLRVPKVEPAKGTPSCK